MKRYATTASIFVSQSIGSNSNDGLYRQNLDNGHGPVCSLETALHLVYQMRAEGCLQPVQIEILDDVYQISQPVIIKEGTGSITITGNGKTLVHGGMQITGFKQDTFNGKPCFSAHIPAVKDGFWFTDLYIDGSRADMTSIPHDGFFTPQRVENNELVYNAESTWFEAKPEDMALFNKLHNIEDCQLTYYHFWVDAHTPIKHYDPKNGRFDMALRSRYSISGFINGAVMRYRLENVAEAFENANEWYLDRSNATVYYIPANASQTPENICAFVPCCDKLFIVQGSREQPAEYIRFSGLTFSYTRSQHISRHSGNDELLPGDDAGYACDVQSCDAACGAIEFYYAQHCSIENCLFTLLGIHSITINHGCSHIRIYRNTFRHLGGGGIKVNGGAFGCEKVQETHDICIAQNSISHGGLKHAASCGVLIKHAYNVTVSHNDIGYLYYTGISVGWVWGYQNSMTRQNLIEYNHVHHIGQGKLSDMGAIYFLGKQPGTVVRNNLVHDVYGFRYGGTGIYTDEGSSYITIENNIVYNVQSTGFNQHYGKHNTLRNNIVCKCGGCVRHSLPEDHIGFIAEHNIFITDDKPFYGYGTSGRPCEQFIMIQGNHNLFFDTSDNHCFHNTAGVVHTLEQAQQALGLENASLYAAPKFVDYDNNDFRLLPDSSAYALGFQDIDISAIGVTSP